MKKCIYIDDEDLKMIPKDKYVDIGEVGPDGKVDEDQYLEPSEEAKEAEIHAMEIELAYLRGYRAAVRDMLLSEAEGEVHA